MLRSMRTSTDVTTMTTPMKLQTAMAKALRSIISTTATAMTVVTTGEMTTCGSDHHGRWWMG
jgi:hypothetical protein